MSNPPFDTQRLEDKLRAYSQTGTSLDPQVRNRSAIKMIAARAGIHWSEGIFDAQNRLKISPEQLKKAGVPSPCISVCQMSEDTGLCQGCFRTIEEIGVWGNAGTRARMAIWESILQRIEGGHAV